MEKFFKGDDDIPYLTPETVDVCNTPDDQIVLFIERFEALGKEAEALGISTIFIIGCADPINHDYFFDWSAFGHAGLAETRGLVEMVRDRL